MGCQWTPAPVIGPNSMMLPVYLHASRTHRTVHCYMQMTTMAWHGMAWPYG